MGRWVGDEELKKMARCMCESASQSDAQVTPTRNPHPLSQVKNRWNSTLSKSHRMRTGADAVANPVGIQQASAQVQTTASADRLACPPEVLDSGLPVVPVRVDCI